MATFVMQALGCEVSAINTVQFSTLSANNHDATGIVARLTHSQAIIRDTNSSKDARLLLKRWPNFTRVSSSRASTTSMCCCLATVPVPVLSSRLAR